MNEQINQPLQNQNQDDYQLGPIELNILDRVEKGLHLSFDMESLSTYSKKSPKYTGPKQIIFLNGWANINSVYKNYTIGFIIKFFLGLSIIFSFYNDFNLILIPFIFCVSFFCYIIKNIFLLFQHRNSDQKLKFIFWVELNSYVGLFVYFLGFILGELNFINPRTLIFFSLPYLLVASILFVYDENKHDFIYQKKFDIIFAIQLMVISIKFANPSSLRMNYVLFIFLFMAIYLFFLGIFLGIILTFAFFRLYYRNVENWKIRALVWMTFYYLSNGIVFIMFIKGCIVYYKEDVFFENRLESYFHYKSMTNQILIRASFYMTVCSFVNLMIHLLWKNDIKKYLGKIIYKSELQKEVSLRLFTENFTFNLIQVSSTYFTKSDKVEKNLDNNIEKENNSEKDLKTLKKNEKKEEKENNEENCILCYENKPDILIDPCCHGGVCKNCVIKYLKADGKNCPLCKTDIKKLYLLEIDPENGKIFAKGEINI